MIAPGLSAPSDLKTPALPRASSGTYPRISPPGLVGLWGPARRFIDGGMTAGIRVPTILARTWTAYTDVGRIQRALGIDDSESIWVAAVTADGDVLAETLSPPTDESAALIAAAMNQPH